MQGGRRKFDRELKMETARFMVEGGRKVAELARDLEIHEAVLRRWRTDYLEPNKNAYPGKGCLRPDDEEIRKLKKELNDIKEEMDIPKKGVGHLLKTPDEIPVYAGTALPIQDGEDVPDIRHITERLLCMGTKREK